MGPWHTDAQESEPCCYAYAKQLKNNEYFWPCFGLCWSDVFDLGGIMIFMYRLQNEYFNINIYDNLKKNDWLYYRMQFVKTENIITK